ncbi:unnamed protein product [Mytilus coruscus]|uniref:TTF-type domain-containing protein n=1 Tax=Mytilus coruscus TaxID=42192 RepID=A0A6J8D9T0_MYTCO|nr:unnamed protein product [Mytilus coruscus]
MATLAIKLILYIIHSTDSLESYITDHYDNETLASDLRYLCAAELYTNASFYTNLDAFRTDDIITGNNFREAAIRHEALVTCCMIPRPKWSSLIHIAALASVLKRPVYSVYPSNPKRTKPATLQSDENASEKGEPQSDENATEKREPVESPTIPTRHETLDSQRNQDSFENQQPNQPKHFKFPKRFFGKKSIEYRSFQPTWFHKFKWIHNDEALDRAFCHLCQTASRKGLATSSKISQTFIATE